MLNSSAGLLTAIAVAELFPDVEIRAVRETSFGFAVQCAFPHRIGAQTAEQIEERMRQIVREQREIHTLEMLADNARALVPNVRGDGVVCVGQIGDQYAQVEGILLRNTAELGACKLLSLQTERRSLHLLGAARRSRKELKEFVRAWRAYPKVRHEVVGERQGLWRLLPEGFLWLPKGVRARQRLIDFWLAALEVEQIECPPGVALSAPRTAELVTETSPYDPEKGLLDGGRRTVLRFLTMDLPIVRKSLMMLGFSEEVQDRLYRSWRPLSLEARANDQWFGSIPVERNLGLLVEKDHCKGMIFED